MVMVMMIMKMILINIMKMKKMMIMTMTTNTLVIVILKEQKVAQMIYPMIKLGVNFENHFITQITWTKTTEVNYIIT